jgi:hypothetical protein
MPQLKNPRDYNYKPLRQGDLDGLCGVYAVLNALQWLVPEAQNSDYLTKLFDKMMGSIIHIKHVRDGGEEPEIKVVHAFVAEEAKKKFRVDFVRVPHGADEKAFKSPDLAMEAKFKEKEKGVFVFGFEGLDSHFTVAHAVTARRVSLFDSWEYRYFERNLFVWGAPKRSKSKKVIVNPKEFDWMTIG